MFLLGLLRISPRLLHAGLATVAITAAVSAQSLANEGFGYGSLPDLAGGAGGSGWTSAWADVGTDPTTVAGSGLQYPGLSTTAGAAVTPVAVGVYPTSIYQRSFTVPPAGTNTIYVSFLLRDDAAQGIWGGISFGQYPYKMTVGSPPGYYTYGLMMSQGLGSLTSKPLVQGETTLVVCKITRNVSPAAGVAYALYLDPVIGAPEPTYPDATFGLGMLSALPTSLAIDNGTGFTTDEIRVGTSWAAVLPAAPSVWTDVGFAKPGVAGAPHLGGVGPLTAGSTNSVVLTQANPNAPVVQVLGFFAVNAPLLGGILVPEPVAVMPLATDAAGGAVWQVVVPAGIPAGVPVRFQHWIQDSAATFGWSASNGLLGVCP